MPEDSLIVITNAIKTAFIDHPSSGHGTTWDQITKSDEESIHLAKFQNKPLTKSPVRGGISGSGARDGPALRHANTINSPITIRVFTPAMTMPRQISAGMLSDLSLICLRSGRGK